MANPEHLAVVRQGAEAIAQWRRAHPAERFDLSEADLSGAVLRRADLWGANLGGANLSRADLSGADLLGADLEGAHLSGAHLSRANLMGAKLLRADLTRADLFQADLMGADLSGAHLSRANLMGAKLLRADLEGAHLRRAKLMGANLGGAKLMGANLSQASLGSTSLGDVDLSRVEGLSIIKHRSPSSVGVDTLVASFRGAGNRLTPDLAAFSRGAGVPQELLEALPRILAEVKYYTCFIAYGQPDVEFAKKLCTDLEARGVSCWLYALDATVGERTWREIGLRRREAERMVVLCSAQALIRGGVRKEIEEQIDEDPDKMVPISLEDLWRQKGFKVVRGDRDLKPFLLDRNYADFANLPYEEAMERLLAGLRRRDAAAPTSP